MKNKKKFIKLISNSISSIDDVISINFVGSFLNSSNYSDIDLIIITKKINKDIFKKCSLLIKKIDTKNLGIKKKIIINDTFGPLKFDNKKNLVIHLMMYSIKHHINHVNSSPFTCYDWERFKPSYGKKLKDIYPVSKLLISDFMLKNRGIKEYKRSLDNRSIDYKKYQFKNNTVLIKNLNYKIIGKDVHEFCYHIITFLLKNYLKLVKNVNREFTLNEVIILLNKISKINNDKKLVIFYKKLVNFKRYKQIYNSDDESVFNTKKFLQYFENYFKKNCVNINKIDFRRHFRTKYNKSVFIGQRRNPSIKPQHKVNKLYDLSISSPLLRAKQTAKTFSNKIIINNLLKEIDYGDVEGSNIKNLKKNFPALIEKWKNFKDAKFPNGESLKQVSKRVIKFINYLKKRNYKNIVVVTHNVFMRCLIGKYFNLPIHNWHKIQIEYGTAYGLKIINNKFVFDISRKKLNILFKKIYEDSYFN